MLFCREQTVTNYILYTLSPTLRLEYASDRTVRVYNEIIQNLCNLLVTAHTDSDLFSESVISEEDERDKVKDMNDGETKNL